MPQKPHLIRFVEPDASLIAFTDNTILLTDMSSQYTVEPTLYIGHNTTITNLQVFLADYFVSLDTSGVIKVWLYKETPVSRRRRSKKEREDVYLGARQNMDLTDPECFGAQNATCGLCLQTIDNRDKHDRNLCFLILNKDKEVELRMFVATESGHIHTYEWNGQSERFESRKSESFDTKIDDIRELFFIPKKYLMAVNAHGTNAFFSLMNHAQVPRTRKMELSTDAPIGIHRINTRRKNTATVTQPNSIVIVYCNRIFKVTISVIAEIMSPEQRAFTLSDEDQNFITCSAVTEDHEYLILGTKKGIIVYDLNYENGRELLRSSISDNITCIDVCQLDDYDAFKYVIISATKKGGPAINMHGVSSHNNTMQWVSNRMGSPINENNLNGRDSLNGYLSGGQLFDVVEDTSNNCFKLMAADSNYNVHQKSSSDRFIQSLSSERMSSKITAVSIGLKSSFVACENGYVYRSEVDRPFMMFRKAVKFLKYYEELDVVVAGSQDLYHIWARGKLHFGEEGRIGPPIVQSFLYEGRFIVLVKEDCSMDVSSNVVLGAVVAYNGGWIR